MKRVLQLIMISTLLDCGELVQRSVGPPWPKLPDAGSQEVIDAGDEPDAGEVPDAGDPPPPPPEDAGEDPGVDAGRDAGTMEPPDAGPPPDAGRPPPPSDGGLGVGGPSRCSTAGLKFCEGFETGAIDTTTWSSQVDPGTNNALAVATTHAARGTHALHVSAGNASGTDVLLKTTKGFPFSGNAFWGRAFVYVEGALPTCNWNFISASGASATYDFAGQGTPFCSATGQKVFRFHYSPGDLANKSTKQIPTDRWQCWEWYFKSNELHAWVDGQELDMAVIGTWAAPQFSSLAIGLHHAHPEPLPRYDLWFDEVAMDGNRIGCDR